DLNLSARSISFAIKGRHILHDMDLEVQGGKTTVLLGPNGAGKSTLMKILSGYLKASDGEVMIAGCDPAKISLKARARMLGVLTQRSSLEFPFTAREVIAMGRMPFGVSEGFDEVTQELLGMFGVAADQSYLTMSGGEQQLVQLCRVFAQVWGRGSEAFLLLDEPMTALDLRYQSKIVSILKKFSSQGLGQLVVMHDINLAAELADEIVLMSSGKVIAKGSAAEALKVDNLERTFDTVINQLGGGRDRYFRAELEK
ncbi:MAG: ATP-binding cassette domain-containing protein, partial [Gammaproteobacteria bacterium]|nr:ATP-binding cassette domain-containing protein [Gammaproteobacteria bacterium]